MLGWVASALSCLECMIKLGPSAGRTRDCASGVCGVTEFITEQRIRGGEHYCWRKWHCCCALPTNVCITAWAFYVDNINQLFDVQYCVAVVVAMVVAVVVAQAACFTKF